MNKDDDVTLIPVAIASQAAAGNVATIPTTQATAGDGRVSIDLGYPPECAISVAAGGKYPEMQDANGVYRLLSSAIRSNQSWGILPFDADFAAGIGGYPAGAIVSGSTPGLFWVSTADNNTTTPGASGATWQSLFAGYITQAQSDARYLMLSSTALQTVTGPVTLGGTTLVPAVTDWTQRQALGAADADGRYVGKAVSNFDYSPIQAGIQKSTGNLWVSYNDGSGLKFAISQPAGDYATNTALNAEITNRTNADTNLNNTKVNRDGDTMSGTLILSQPRGTNTVGQMNFTPGLILDNTYGVRAEMFGQENVGNTTDFTLRLWFNGTVNNYWWFNQDGDITSQKKGPVAWLSDFSTSDSRVINLPYGHRIQAFTVYVDGNGSNSHRITYPQAFSGNSTVTFNCNDTGQSRSVSLSNGTTPDSTGFNISVSVHGNSTGPSTDGLTLTVIAIGPK